MKASILGLFVLALSLSAHADTEKREYKKVNANEAVVTITTEETDGTQAAVYVDAAENKKFIEELLKDPKSKLAQAVSDLEMSTCGANSTPENPWIDGCGEVTITDAVRTSFGRGGWMSAGAGYTFFVGFTSDGSGRFFDVSYMVTISEGAEAQVKGDDSFEYSGVVLKSLSLDKVEFIGVERAE